jgi:hypothetical protein
VVGIYIQNDSPPFSRQCCKRDWSPAAAEDPSDPSAGASCASLFDQRKSKLPSGECAGFESSSVLGQRRRHGTGGAATQDMVQGLRPPQVSDQLEPTFADPCATNFRRAGSSPRQAKLDAAVPQRYIFQPDISNARISGSISARLDRMEDDAGCNGLVPLKKMAGHLPEAASSNGSSSSRGSYPPAIGHGTLQSDIDRYRPPPSHCPNRKVGESYIDMVGGSQTTRGHSAVSAIRSAGERKPLKPLNAASLDVFRANKQQKNGGGTSAKMMPNPRFVGEPNESTPHTRTFGTQITPRGVLLCYSPSLAITILHSHDQARDETMTLLTAAERRS